jgi:serine/threonine protein phosphatase 1
MAVSDPGLPSDRSSGLNDEALKAAAPRRRFGIFPVRGYRPSVPRGRRVYAVGDIHGCHDLLVSLLGKILSDAARSTAKPEIVFLGDYIDRGPDSSEVIVRLLDLQRTVSSHFVRGNHDQALLDFLALPSTYREWERFGAGATLLSYGVQPPQSHELPSLIAARDRLARALPAAHLRFLHALQPSVTIGDYIFVHAGIRPDVPLSNQSLHDLMWIRDEFLESSSNHGKIVVHGHTPVAEPDCRQNRIGIDTGAYSTGRLTALVLEGNRRRFLYS